jgi:hypothetical protein
MNNGKQSLKRLASACCVALFAEALISGTGNESHSAVSCADVVNPNFTNRIAEVLGIEEFFGAFSRSFSVTIRRLVYLVQ